MTVRPIASFAFHTSYLVWCSVGREHHHLPWPVSDVVSHHAFSKRLPVHSERAALHQRHLRCSTCSYSDDVLDGNLALRRECAAVPVVRSPHHDPCCAGIPRRPTAHHLHPVHAHTLHLHVAVLHGCGLCGLGRCMLLLHQHLHVARQSRHRWLGQSLAQYPLCDASGLTMLSVACVVQAAAMAILFRQTNAVWVAGVVFTPLLQNAHAAAFPSFNIVKFLTFIRQSWKRFLAPMAMHIAALVAFAAFVLRRGSIVVGTGAYHTTRPAWCLL